MCKGELNWKEKKIFFLLSNLSVILPGIKKFGNFLSNIHEVNLALKFFFLWGGGGGGGGCNYLLT